MEYIYTFTWWSYDYHMTITWCFLHKPTLVLLIDASSSKHIVNLESSVRLRTPPNIDCIIHVCTMYKYHCAIIIITIINTFLVLKSLSSVERWITQSPILWSHHVYLCKSHDYHMTIITISYLDWEGVEQVWQRKRSGSPWSCLTSIRSLDGRCLPGWDNCKQVITSY